MGLGIFRAIIKPITVYKINSIYLLEEGRDEKCSSNQSGDQKKKKKRGS